MHCLAQPRIIFIVQDRFFTAACIWQDCQLSSRCYTDLVHSLRTTMRFLRRIAAQSVGPIFGLALFVLAVWVLRQKLMLLHSHTLLISISSIPHRRILAALLFTCLDYFILTSFDSLALRFIGHHLQYWKIAMTSFLCYAFGHNIGFPMLSGSTIRYRLYSQAGISIKCITEIIGFCTLTFWLGFLTVGSILFLFRPLPIPRFFHLPFTDAQPLGFLFLVALIGFVIWNIVNTKPMTVGKWQLPKLDTDLLVAQIAVASLELLLASGVLYSLLPPGIPFFLYFGIFLLAQLSGLASQVPGGIGVFEGVILVLVPPRLGTSSVMAALIVYRAVYYILPLIAAIALFAIHEIRRHIRAARSV